MLTVNHKYYSDSLNKVFILLLLFVLISIYTSILIRVYKLLNLYNVKTIANNFLNMDKDFIDPNDQLYLAISSEKYMKWLDKSQDP